MKQYLDLLQDILDNGEEKDDRTGVGTRSVFGRQLRFDLRKSFPAVTTKKLAFKACKGELIWFLTGSSDERDLAEITHGSRDGPDTIWTSNANAPSWLPKAQYKGDLGRVYGVQWREWLHIEDGRDNKEFMEQLYKDYPDLRIDMDDDPNDIDFIPIFHSIDQVAKVIEGLKKDPNGRRHIISAWNVADVENMALPPCHVMSQYYINKNKELSCHMYQRSVDVFLGLPFNIASYALLTHMLAQVCGYKVGELIISTGDTHIYKNHIDQVKEQLSREILPPPTLKLNPAIMNIDDFKMDDIELVGYQSHASIKAEMAQ
jgi:thymidylate synthase